MVHLHIVHHSIAAQGVIRRAQCGEVHCKVYIYDSALAVHGGSKWCFKMDSKWSEVLCKEKLCTTVHDSAWQCMTAVQGVRRWAQWSVASCRFPHSTSSSCLDTAPQLDFLWFGFLWISYYLTSDSINGEWPHFSSCLDLLINWIYYHLKLNWILMTSHWISYHLVWQIMMCIYFISGFRSSIG